jgi:hypothetical protein
MANSSANKAFAARAAAILTNAEVKATSFDLNNAYDSALSVELSFTLGSLTNVIMKFYVSMDGSTWFDAGDFSAANSYTITASTTKAFAIQHPGWKFFAVGLTGTGTVTSSSATVNLRYLRRGSQ